MNPLSPRESDSSDPFKALEIMGLLGRMQAHCAEKENMSKGNRGFVKLSRSQSIKRDAEVIKD